MGKKCGFSQHPPFALKLNGNKSHYKPFLIVSYMLRAVLSVYVFLPPFLFMQCTQAYEILWHWSHAQFHVGNQTSTHQSYNELWVEGRNNRWKGKKRETEEAVIQERERERLEILTTIAFLSRTPTVTQPFFGRSRLWKKGKKGDRESELWSYVQCSRTTSCSMSTPLEVSGEGGPVGRSDEQPAKCW